MSGSSGPTTFTKVDADRALTEKCLAAGITASTSFALMSFAFARVEASVLAPFQYLEIFGATIVGYLVFGDLPDMLTWLGVAIILASGLYVFHRERTLAEPRPHRRRIWR